jgi:hypothetical protein
LALGGLDAATQKDDERSAVLSKIHPVAWACFDAKFGNAIAHRLAIAQSAQSNAFQPEEHAGLKSENRSKLAAS